MSRIITDILQVGVVRTNACKTILSVAAVALLAVSGSANAVPVLELDSAGKLTGASGVTVGSLGTYDVSFVDGTCIEVFSGCDEATDFDFNSSAATIAASLALFDQVFTGSLDDDPTRTFGCSDRDICAVFTPARAFLFDFHIGYVEGTAAANTAAGFSIGDFLAPNGEYGNLLDRDVATSDSVSGGSRRVWARWKASVAAPEPGTLGLIGLSLIGLVAVRCRRSS